MTKNEAKNKIISYIDKAIEKMDAENKKQD